MSLSLSKLAAREYWDPDPARTAKPQAGSVSGGFASYYLVYV